MLLTKTRSGEDSVLALAVTRRVTLSEWSTSDDRRSSKFLYLTVTTREQGRLSRGRAPSLLGGPEQGHGHS